MLILQLAIILVAAKIAGISVRLEPFVLGLVTETATLVAFSHIGVKTARDNRWF